MGSDLPVILSAPDRCYLPFDHEVNQTMRRNIVLELKKEMRRQLYSEAMKLKLRRDIDEGTSYY